MKPLAIDLFCGLGGWTEGLLAEGYFVVGFDTERHRYGGHGYPGQLVIQDVRTLCGAQFRDAALIVASPPCQAYSYRAMPWKRAKALGPPDNELFEACFRIQREACAAAGRHVPLVVENVRGAQKWVGRARWNFGSFYLWGDVPALMPVIAPRTVMKAGVAHRGNGETNFHGAKQDRELLNRDGHNVILPQVVNREGVKVAGMNWSGFGKPGYVAQGMNTVADQRLRAGIKDGGDWFGSGADYSLPRKFSGAKQRERDPMFVRGFTQSAVDQLASGIKQPGISGMRTNGRGDRWFAEGAARHGSQSSNRKAASAMIAKIPLPLARHIAAVFHPGPR